MHFPSSRLFGFLVLMISVLNFGTPCFATDLPTLVEKMNQNSGESVVFLREFMSESLYEYFPKVFVSAYFDAIGYSELGLESWNQNGQIVGRDRPGNSMNSLVSLREFYSAFSYSNAMASPNGFNMNKPDGTVICVKLKDARIPARLFDFVKAHQKKFMEFFSDPKINGKLEERILNAFPFFRPLIKTEGDDLYEAVLEGNVGLVGNMLDQGKNPNLPSHNGHYPLALASEIGLKPIVDLLLAHHANPNAIDSGETTALHTAASEGHFEIAQALLDHGASPNLLNADEQLRSKQDAQLGGFEAFMFGSSALDPVGSVGPLFISAQAGTLEVFNLLLQSGADPNQASTNGHMTPLITAAYHGHTSIVQSLLNNRAGIAPSGPRRHFHIPINTAATFDSKTARTWAKQAGHLGIVELIDEYERRRENGATSDPSVGL